MCTFLYQIPNKVHFIKILSRISRKKEIKIIIQKLNRNDSDFKLISKMIIFNKISRCSVNASNLSVLKDKVKEIKKSMKYLESFDTDVKNLLI